jgi:Secretion system C-terminal sorting domain
MTTVPSLSSNQLWEKAQSCPVAFGTYNVGMFHFAVGTPYREVCNVLNISPGFRLTNLGDATLTQATIKVKWNGTEMNQIQWSGFLQKFEYEEINAGSIAVTDGGQLNVSVSIPDHQDQFLGNNEIITSFTPAKIFTYDTLLLKVRTDEFGYETYWEFRDEYDNVLQKGGNSFVGPNGGGVIISPNWQSPGTYPKNSTIQKELVVPQNGCYSLHIVDAFGDGLTCSNCGGGGSSSASGYYKLYNKNNPFNPLISGSAFTSYSRHYFKVNSSVLSSGEPEAAGHLELFPNPVNALLNVQFNANQGQQIKMEVLNVLGERVHLTAENKIPAGLNTWTIPVEYWPSGTYNLIISGEMGRTSKQFVHIR